MKLLVTGANGFVGTYVSTWEGAVPFNPPGKVPIDLLDLGSVRDRVAEIGPDAVLHLAAKNHVPDSIQNPRATLETNFFGTFHLLQALQDNHFTGRMLFIGSADAYGAVEVKDLPITENLPLRPRNPYAVSKAAAEALCYQTSLSCGFEIVLARPFNHIGSGQNERFAISGFAKEIMQIKAGLRPPKMRVGDLDISRDFSDVRDVVRAYQLLLEKGGSGEVFNVCSGRESKISDLLKWMLAAAELEVSFETDASRLRPQEQRRVVGSHEKLHRATGWKPDIPLETTLKDLLAYWKGKVS